MFLKPIKIMKSLNKNNLFCCGMQRYTFQSYKTCNMYPEATFYYSWNLNWQKREFIINPIEIWNIEWLQLAKVNEDFGLLFHWLPFVYCWIDCNFSASLMNIYTLSTRCIKKYQITQWRYHMRKESFLTQQWTFIFIRICDKIHFKVVRHSNALFNGSIKNNFWEIIIQKWHWYRLSTFYIYIYIFFENFVFIETGKIVLTAKKDIVELKFAIIECTIQLSISTYQRPYILYTIFVK